MGIAKELMMHEAHQLDVASDIAVDSGVLARCAYHGTITHSLSGDPSPAYALGTARFKEGEFEGTFSNRTDMTNAIKAAIDDAGMDCSGCSKGD